MASPYARRGRTSRSCRARRTAGRPCPRPTGPNATGWSG
jgi:hypothetical protein